MDERARLVRALTQIASNLPRLIEVCAPIGGIIEALALLGEATDRMVEHIDELAAAAAGAGESISPP